MKFDESLNAITDGKSGKPAFLHALMNNSSSEYTDNVGILPDYDTVGVASMGKGMMYWETKHDREIDGDAQMLFTRPSRLEVIDTVPRAVVHSTKKMGQPDRKYSADEIPLRSNLMAKMVSEKRPSFRGIRRDETSPLRAKEGNQI